MNQKEIGMFIAKLRKELKMTQAELGSRIGVTNKTVSRWENGDYMPDISVMSLLCRELGISINELIAAKKLEPEEYKPQAEKNMTWSLKELKYLKKTQRISDGFGGAGAGLLVALSQAPDSGRKTVALFIALTMLCVSWYLRSKYDSIVLGEDENLC